MYDAIKNRIEININKNYRLKIFEEIKQGNITTEVRNLFMVYLGSIFVNI